MKAKVKALTAPSQTLTTAAQAELRQSALVALQHTQINAKLNAVNALAQAWHAGQITLNTTSLLPEPAALPGLPPDLTLVAPSQLAKRSMNTLEGRAALIHAIAHIEFNAINLALDAIWRFANLPAEFYSDWLRVAQEEALHFSLLHAHLQGMGYRYGDFDAHNGLWKMAQKTRHDVLAHLALVPRTLEARGLDVTPGLRAKLLQAGDNNGVAILDIILRDEIGHVAIGNRWYYWACQQQGREPIAIYQELVAEYDAPRIAKPINREARLQAGFSAAELDNMDNQ